MANHSNSLAWKIQWTEDPGGPQCRGRDELAATEHISQYFMKRKSHSVVSNSLQSHGL